MVRQCDVCSVEYLAKRRSSRFCSDRCRKRANRGAATLTGHAKVFELDTQPAPLVVAVKTELDQAGRLFSSIGCQAVLLAERLSAVSYDTGSSTAALSKELRVTIERALKDVVIEDDPLDEL